MFRKTARNASAKQLDEHTAARIVEECLNPCRKIMAQVTRQPALDTEAWVAAVADRLGEHIEKTYGIDDIEQRVDLIIRIVERERR